MSTGKDRAAQYALQTRSALLDSAKNLFGTMGYMSASLDEICAEAGLTKGALYHHFKGKQDLFEAVYGEVCAAFMERVRAHLSTPTDDLFARSVAAIQVWLEAGLADVPARSILAQAPAVLGWERWRALERDHVGDVIADVLGALMDEGLMQPLPVQEFAAILNACIVESTLLIAHSDDADATKQAVQTVLTRLLQGVRT